MAHFWEGEKDDGGIRMRDMLRVFSLFPWFAFLSLLIPWQTLMRLQLPGSANSTSIIHPVQLHPLNSPRTCSVSYPNTHTYPFQQTMAWLLAVTAIKALHYLFVANPKYELKSSRKEVTPEAFSKGCCITQQQTDCLVWKEGDKRCLGFTTGTKCLCAYTKTVCSLWWHRQSLNCSDNSLLQHDVNDLFPPIYSQLMLNEVLIVLVNVSGRWTQC